MDVIKSFTIEQHHILDKKMNGIYNSIEQDSKEKEKFQTEIYKVLENQEQMITQQHTQMKEMADTVDSINERMKK